MLKYIKGVVVNDDGVRKPLDYDRVLVSGTNVDSINVSPGTPIVFGIRLPVWTFFANILSFKYRVFKIRKKNKSFRVIEEPPLALKRAQRCILDEVLASFPLPNCIVGFRKNMSIPDALKRHEGKNILFKMDLHNFFPSISYDMVKKTFELPVFVNYMKDVVDYENSRGILQQKFVQFMSLLPALVTRKRNHLPQGAPTSPTVANIVFIPIDIEITKYCKKKKIEYCRYSDDLLFSTDEEYSHEELDKIREKIKEIITSHFDGAIKINRKKDRVFRKPSRQVFLGVVLNEVMNPSRYERRRMRAILHNIERTGFEEQAHRYGNYTSRDFYKHILGKVNWWCQINDKYQPYRERVKQLWKDDKAAQLESTMEQAEIITALETAKELL